MSSSLGSSITVMIWICFLANKSMLTQNNAVVTGTDPQQVTNPGIIHSPHFSTLGSSISAVLYPEIQPAGPVVLQYFSKLFLNFLLIIIIYVTTSKSFNYCKHIKLEDIKFDFIYSYYMKCWFFFLDRQDFRNFIFTIKLRERYRDFSIISTSPTHV